MGPLPDRNGAAVRVTGAVGLELPLSARLAVSAGVTAARVERGLRALPTGSALVAFGVR